MTKREAPIYKVIFLNQGQVFEMYAKQIYQSDLWGFLEVEEFVFGERTQVVVRSERREAQGSVRRRGAQFCAACIRSCASTRSSAWVHRKSAKPAARSAM